VHLLLTDRLTCPRCGPTFGLILRADRLVDRVVWEGVLGCPNCRDAFPVVEGFGDLRAPPRGELPAGLVGPVFEERAPAGEAAERLAALLGLVGGPGTVCLVGGPARHAPDLAARVPEVSIVGVDSDLRGWPETPGVSRIVSRPGIPLFSGTVRAVAVDGRLGGDWIREAVRITAPRGARVVVDGADEGARAALAGTRVRVLAQDAETVVATTG